MERALVLPQPGYYGTARRGPCLNVADVAVVKQVTAGATRVQLRLEAFNSHGTPCAGAAHITTGATPARQVQLGARMAF